MITGKLYDVLKWIAQIFLPGLGTLYFTLAGIWGLPNADEVVGTVMSIDLFLGLLLGVSQVNYAKDVAMVGDMVVSPKEGGGTVHTLEIDDDKVLDTLQDKKEVRFRVKKKTTARRSKKGETGLTMIETVVVLTLVLALAAFLFSAGVLK